MPSRERFNQAANLGLLPRHSGPIDGLMQRLYCTRGLHASPLGPAAAVDMRLFGRRPRMARRRRRQRDRCTQRKHCALLQASLIAIKIALRVGSAVHSLVICVF
jgi:hypothetical protein